MIALKKDRKLKLLNFVTFTVGTDARPLRESLVVFSAYSKRVTVSMGFHKVSHMGNRHHG